MKTKKKGEVASQAFIYILTLVVVAVIFLIGQNFFTTQKETTSKVELASLKSKIVNDVSAVTKEFGSFKKVGYKVKDIQEICFADTSLSNTIVASEEITKYPLIQDSVASGTGKNVFVYGNSLLDSYNAGDILVVEAPHFKCISNTNGELAFALEWKRGSARVLPGLVPLGSEMTLEDFISIFGDGISQLDDLDDDLDGVDPTLDDLQS